MLSSITAPLSGINWKLFNTRTAPTGKTGQGNFKSISKKECEGFAGVISATAGGVIGRGLCFEAQSLLNNLCSPDNHGDLSETF